MKDRDDKFFIPFPEYFVNSKNEIKLYSFIEFFFDDWPMSATIIFTKSSQLEDIKNAVERNFEKSKKSRFSTEKKLVIKDYYQKISQYQPEEPGYKLQFAKGKPGRYRFDEINRVLTVYINSETLPDVSKAFYYRAGVYESSNMW